MISRKIILITGVYISEFMNEFANKKYADVFTWELQYVKVKTLSV